MRTFRWKKIAAALCAALTLGSALPAPARAADAAPETIRVALFYDIGTRKSITGAVTLSSEGGMALTFVGVPAGTREAGRPVRFAIDGYRALLAETTDAAAAMSLWKRLKESSSAASVTRLHKSGRTVYQVTEGVYASAAEATAALERWKAAGLPGIPSQSPAGVLGPHAVEAGPYADEAAAARAAAAFGEAGWEAFVTLKPAGGKLTYAVRIGQLADAGQLAALEREAKAAGLAGSAPVRIPEAEELYAVVREDVSGDGAAPTETYAIPAHASAAWKVRPAGDGFLRVDERSGRTYRGEFEIGAHNGQLAVVNIVGLEEYLYAVVGAEMPASFHEEALKAQAVAARTYALSVGNAWEIANVDDTTSSQAYYGTAMETPQAVAAVRATAGQVLTYMGKPINAVYSANSGGVTADSAEVWGTEVPYVRGGTSSPDDGAERSVPAWYKVVLEDGTTGYIRGDLLADTGRVNPAGAPVYRVTGDGVAVRPKPTTQSDAVPLTRVNAGTTVTVLGVMPENNSYRWIEPLSADRLLASLNARAKTKIAGPLVTLEVGERGPSGRALYVLANGQKVELAYPDQLRGALGGIRSTLIDIEETGRFTVLGGGQTKREFPREAGTLYVLGAAGGARSHTHERLFILDGDGRIRDATMSPSFVISGKGYGHGLGLSQWGAHGLALQGLDYRAILQHYYPNTKLEHW
mgnify:FL=1